MLIIYPKKRGLINQSSRVNNCINKCIQLTKTTSFYSAF